MYNLMCFVFITMLIKFSSAVPPDYCLKPANLTDCGGIPTVIFSFYPPGSRCEVEVWRGCPTLNKFTTEYECLDHCVYHFYRFGIAQDEAFHINLGDYGTDGDQEVLTQPTTTMPPLPERCREDLNTSLCTEEESGQTVYTYNTETGECQQTKWYDCLPAENMFKSALECVNVCLRAQEDWHDQLTHLDDNEVEDLNDAMQDAIDIIDNVHKGNESVPKPDVHSHEDGNDSGKNNSSNNSNIDDNNNNGKNHGSKNNDHNGKNTGNKDNNTNDKNNGNNNSSNAGNNDGESNKGGNETHSGHNNDQNTGNDTTSSNKNNHEGGNNTHNGENNNHEHGNNSVNGDHNGGKGNGNKGNGEDNKDNGNGKTSDDDPKDNNINNHNSDNGGHTDNDDNGGNKVSDENQNSDNNHNGAGDDRSNESKKSSEDDSVPMDSGEAAYTQVNYATTHAQNFKPKFKKYSMVGRSKRLMDFLSDN